MPGTIPTIDLKELQRGLAPHKREGLTDWQTELLARLLDWFGVEFHLVDGKSGQLLHCAWSQSGGNWDALGELCRAVSSRGTAEIVAEDLPLVTLAVPFDSRDEGDVVALGVFVSQHACTPGQLARAAETLGLESEDAVSWVAAQTPTPPESLLRVAQGAMENVASATRLKAAEQEIEDLSQNLSTTYEEISLLYRLTQHLKLSAKEDEFGELALEWLAEVLPAEGVAIQFARSTPAEAIGHGARHDSLLLTYGNCPVSSEELTRIVQHVGLAPGQRPVIINPVTSLSSEWPWKPIREMVLVPMCEGANCFGWLAAFNHLHGGEFGSVEASLLSSVAAILGIHSGNAELYQQQREFFAGVVRALTSAIDAKDPYTCGHSERVARVAVRLAEELGCEPQQIDTIYLAGLLHDVGKIGIDDNVLRKPGKLTEAEYEHIKTHTEIGYKILSDIKQLDDILPVVLHHHEQWDGLGYPHGLSGENIPFLARIVAVADSFDAMHSDRPYRQGLSDTKLDSIMHDGAGQQWDASVVAAFFRVRDEIRDIGQSKARSLSIEAREWM